MRRLLALVGVSGALLVVGSAPAEAHTVGGVGATNFRTTLEHFTPDVPGVELRVVENGSRLEVRDTTDTPVVVRGYQDEPYARIGPDGVFVNENSPAYYLNADRYGVATVPDRADPKKPPAWRKLSDDQVFRWHDHRTHWMQSTLPPLVSQAPDERHQISSWTIRLDYGGRALTGTGTLVWVPGPEPWGWLAAGVLLLVVPAALWLVGRRWAWPALAVATVLVVIADAAHSVGVAVLAAEPTDSPVGFVVPLLPQLAVWSIGGLAAWLLFRRRDGGAWAAAVAGVCVAVVSGFPDLPVFWRSSAPTVLPVALDRITVVVGLGLGLGLIGPVGALLLRRRPAQASSGPKRLAAPDNPVEPDAGEPGAEDPGAGDVDAEGPGAEGPGAEGPGAGDTGDGDTGAGDDVGSRGRPRVSRRELVGAAVATGVGGLAGAGLQLAAGPDQSTAAAPASAGTPLSAVGSRIVPFHGERQAGIANPVRRQAHARVAAFDLVPGVDAAALRGLLQRWTAAAEALTIGRPVGGQPDTVTAGSGPAALTITVGFGPSLFGKAGLPATARPAALAPLPAFAGESLDAARSDGDLGVVACADDPVVVYAALRRLERLAAGVAVPRWQFAGFTSGRGVATDESATGRNLMGHRDGTRNPKPTEATFDRTVFVPGDDWMGGGSYLVVRRIRMLLDEWEALPVAAQEQVIGRRKESGAPLSGGVETTPANFGRTGADGAPLIGADAHIRLATPAFNQGAAMLRRGYSFADPRPDGGVDAGLIFLAWQSDPRTGFIPVQQNLVGVDRLNRFIRHETSALFAMPVGVAKGEFLGQRLFDKAGR